MGSTLCDFVVDFNQVDWHVANWMFKQQHQVKRRLFLMLTITTNLGILGYFKYDEFLLDN
jgi:alginate O-acetyltransferase complex protein AlgI